MFFASCEYACPIIVHDLKRLQESLPAPVREKVGITLITFDCERDTVEALRAFRQRMELPEDCWTLLRAGSDDVLEIAALLGVKFKQEARGQFAHSNLMTILNAEGEIVHQIAGLHQDVTPAAKILAALAK
jgi:protein SCO1/2